MSRQLDSLYIHFPFCKHLCNYCDFFKSVPKNSEMEIDAYQQFLEQSYQAHEKLLLKYNYEWSPLKTLYIGGGTPSLWGAGGALFLEKFLQEKNILLDAHCEFTLEVNPGGWTEESLREWRRIGVNRFSLGIQSYDSAMIKLLDRVHSLDDVKDLLTYFKKMDVNYSVDFMLGLPSSEEHKRNVLHELDEVLAYNPNHISLYILTVKSNYVHLTKLPSEEWIESEYLSVSKYLQEKGYKHYEVSNFAKPGFESLHNLNYWKSKSVGALGPSATGFLSEAKLRYKWKTKHAEFEEENLQDDQIRLEYVYMALRSSVGLERDFFQNIDLDSVFKRWVEERLAIIQNDRIFLTSAGFLILDSLMDDLFKKKAL